ncbi:MAG: hypothetical protein JWN95_1868 [Frankiales bacterium]|nr:hypothetical protein [Frankiales bacterium]
MVRRLALAQAIVADPHILLLDEPTTGLDPAQRAGLRQLVAEVAVDRAVVFSSHLIEDIEAICDRVIVLHEGQVYFDGAPDALRMQADDPAAPQATEQAFLRLISRPAVSATGG